MASGQLEHAPPLLASLHGSLNSLLVRLVSSGEAAKAAVRIHFAAPGFMSPVQSSSSCNSSTLARASAPPSISNLCGTWIKDKHASDSMEQSLRLMHLRGVVRQAVKLLKGINIKQDAERVTIEVFSVIGWFKVVEHYRFTGEPASFKRRDLRRGNHLGSFRLLPPATSPAKALTLRRPKSSEGSEAESTHQGRFAIDISWGLPHSGTGSDTYELVAPDVLQVWSTLNVDGEQVKTRSIFHRKQ